MSFKKIQIYRETKLLGITGYLDIYYETQPAALFNPNSLEITKQASWEVKRKNDSNVGEMSFGGGQPRSLSIELFFDTYDKGPALLSLDTVLEAADVLALYPFSSSSATDVRDYTDKIAELLQIDGELGRPPRCKLEWGSYGKIFEGCLEQLTERFVLFQPDGTPVRAYLNCTFKEYKSPEEDKKEQNPVKDEDPTRVAKRGDTLSSIASEEFNDPKLWRVIARANGITNPRRLVPGTMLTIPVLTAGDMEQI